MIILEKMWLMIILKVTKNQGFSLSLEHFWKNHRELAKLIPPAPSSLIRVKYKAALVGKTADAANNADSSVKTSGNSCSIKVLKEFQEICRNVISQLQNSS